MLSENCTDILSKISEQNKAIVKEREKGSLVQMPKRDIFCAADFISFHSVFYNILLKEDISLFCPETWYLELSIQAVLFSDARWGLLFLDLFTGIVLAVFVPCHEHKHIGVKVKICYVCNLRTYNELAPRRKHSRYCEFKAGQHNAFLHAFVYKSINFLFIPLLTDRHQVIDSSWYYTTVY